MDIEYPRFRDTDLINFTYCVQWYEVLNVHTAYQYIPLPPKTLWEPFPSSDFGDLDAVLMSSTVYVHDLGLVRRNISDRDNGHFADVVAELCLMEYQSFSRGGGANTVDEHVFLCVHSPEMVVRFVCMLYMFVIEHISFNNIKLAYYICIPQNIGIYSIYYTYIRAHIIKIRDSAYPTHLAC